MKSKDADTTVRVRVGPSVSGCSVVNRQNLQYPLACLRHPVNHFAQIAEVSDTKTFLGTKGENGNQSTSNLQRRYIETSFRQLIYDNITFSKFRQLHLAVETAFPKGCHFIFFVSNCKLKLQVATFQQLFIQVHNPLVDIVFCHLYSLVYMP